MSHVSYLASGHSFPSEHTATSTLASTRESAGIVITVHARADTHTIIIYYIYIGSLEGGKNLHR